MAADNTILNTGTGGDTIRDLARLAGSVKTQVIALDLGGAAGNAENLITAGQQTMANSMPVAIASNQTSLPVTATQSLGSAATRFFAQVSDGTNSPAIKAASTAAVAADPALTVAISPNNALGITQSDTSISGTISATDILAAAPAGNGVLIATAPTVNSFVAALVPGGTAQADIQITGTATGTYYFEGSMDSTTGSDGNWIAVNYRQTGITNTVLGYSATAGGVYRGAPSGFKYIRVRNVGGTAPNNPIIFRYSNGSGTTFLNASIPAGTNAIGSVTNTTFAATQATAANLNATVVGTGTFATQSTLAAETTKVIGTVNVAAAQTIAVTQATAANLNATVVGNGTFVTQSTLAAETTKVIGAVRNLGNVGAIFDGAPATAAPANGLQVGGQFVTAPATLTTGQFGSLQLTAAQNLKNDIATIAGTAPTTVGKLDVKGADGDVFVRQATAANFNATVTQLAITKGTQGTTGVTTQDLKDAGRNAIHYYTVIPVLSTATDTLQSLTATNAGVTVAPPTATPAVVTTAKKFRVTRVSATYIATATSGYGIVRVRFNTAGVVAITSPVCLTLAVGSSAPATANAADSMEAAMDEGWEFAAGTGVGISVQGFAAVTATAVGYVMVSLTGYEY